MRKLNYLLMLFLMTVYTCIFAQPVNNECSGAIELTSSLGRGIDNVITTGPYNNTSATTEKSDPTIGFECFAEPDGSGAKPSLENTLWFTFTGDGDKYFIEATSDSCSFTNEGLTYNDTQIAIYTGSCEALVPFDCKEDGPNSKWSVESYPAGVEIMTEIGVQYYVMVDGFDFVGTLSKGKFCMNFTQMVSITCNHPDVSAGTVSVEPAILCQPDSIVLISQQGAFGPNKRNTSGSMWVVSKTDLAGDTDPKSAAGFLGAFPVSPISDKPRGMNFAQNKLEPGDYYFTLYTFTNASIDNMGHVIFDPECTFVSNSAKMEYYSEDDCP